MLTVTVGTTVTWKNTTQIAHTVTSGSQPKADGVFDSGMLKAGEEYAQAFNKAGTYSYYCAFHAGMVAMYCRVSFSAVARSRPPL